MNINSVETSPGLGAERTATSSAPVPAAPSASVTKDIEKPVEQAGSESAPSQPLSREQVTRVAQQLEEAINQAYGTKVRFNVATNEDEHKFSFQVVDSETGEVLREFPEDAVLEFARSSKLLDGHGVIIDSPA